MSQQPNQSSIKNFLASRTGLARVGSLNQMKNKLLGKHWEHPTYGINLILDDDLLFSAATVVNILPTVDDAETGLLYIKMPEKELYYLLEEPTKQWIRFSSNAVLNSTDGTILINTTDNVYELSAAPTFTASKNYTDLKIKDFYNKTESDNKFMLKAEISSVYRIKGSKANFNEINNLTTKEKGDVYNAQDTGMNYVWTGDEWDALGSTIDLTNYYTKAEADDKFVEKINGKTLTSNDFTNQLKAKLENIPSDANKNVQADWNENNTNSDSYIKNKPTITQYTLPKASNSILGGIKVGTNLSINNDGVLSADAQQITVDNSLSNTSINPVQNKIIKTELDKKVNSEAGKTLTSNDFTNDLKNKLDNISAGANKNIQPDWNQNDNTKDDFIKNKPVIPTGSILYSTIGTNTNGAMTQKSTTDELNKKVDKVAGKNLSTNDYTNEEKTKLANIQANANKNVQSDWNETDINSDSFIKNKPTIPSGATLYTSTGNNVNGSMTQKAVTDALNNKVDKEVGKGLSTKDYTAADKTLVDGSINTVSVNGTNQTISNHTLSLTIPTKTSQLTNDKNYQTLTDVENKINNKLTSVMVYKGSVNSFASLPTGARTGDVYNVNDTDDNYAFNGTGWDKLSRTIDLSNYLLKTEVVAITNSEIDTIVGA